MCCEETESQEQPIPMDSSQAFQALCDACEQRNYMSFSELQPGEYLVKYFSLVKTTHGERIKIEIGDRYLFLPERYLEKITPEGVPLLNRKPKLMIYRGKDGSHTSDR